MKVAETVTTKNNYPSQTNYQDSNKRISNKSYDQRSQNETYTKTRESERYGKEWKVKGAHKREACRESIKATTKSKVKVRTSTTNGSLKTTSNHRRAITTNGNINRYKHRLKDLTSRTNNRNPRYHHSRRIYRKHKRQSITTKDRNQNMQLPNKRPSLTINKITKEDKSNNNKLELKIERRPFTQ